MKSNKINTLKEIIKEVFLVNIDEDTRRRDVVDARRIYSKILREERFSFELIGESIGKNHATIIHYVRSIDNILEYDKDLREKYIACKGIYLENSESIFENIKNDPDAYVTIIRLRNELHELISLKNKILDKFVDSIEDYSKKNGYMPSVYECRNKLIPLFNK